MYKQRPQSLNKGIDRSIYFQYGQIPIQNQLFYKNDIRKSQVISQSQLYSQSRLSFNKVSDSEPSLIQKVDRIIQQSKEIYNDKKLKNVRKSQTYTQKKMKNTIQKQLQQIQRLQGQLILRDEIIENYYKKLEQKDHDYQKLERQYNNLEQWYSKVKMQLEQAKKINSLENQLYIRNLQVQNKDYKRQISSLKVQIQNLQNETNRLKNQLKQSKAQSKQIKQENKQLLSKIENLDNPKMDKSDFFNLYMNRRKQQLNQQDFQSFYDSKCSQTSTRVISQFMKTGPINKRRTIFKKQQFNKTLSIQHMHEKFQYSQIIQHSTFNISDLIELVQFGTSKIFKKSNLLYRLDLSNSNNVHRYIDDRKQLLLLVEMVNGHILGAYCDGELINGTMYSTENGFLFSLTNKKIFPIQKNQYSRTMVYDNRHIVFGNSQLKIPSNSDKIYSNFGAMNRFFQNNKENVHVLLGEGRDVKEGKMSSYQVYSLQFDNQLAKNNSGRF